MNRTDLSNSTRHRKSKTTPMPVSPQELLPPKTPKEREIYELLHHRKHTVAVGSRSVVEIVRAAIPDIDEAPALSDATDFTAMPPKRPDDAIHPDVESHDADQEVPAILQEAAIISDERHSQELSEAAARQGVKGAFETGPVIEAYVPATVIEKLAPEPFPNTAEVDAARVMAEQAYQDQAERTNAALIQEQQEQARALQERRAAERGDSTA